MRIQILILGFKGLTGIDRPFYRYVGHIELLQFKEYYGMPRGHKHHLLYSLSIRNLAIIIIHPNTAQRSSFPLQSNYSKTNLRKNASKGACK